MIGNSAALAAALDRVSLLAPINRPVLIIGERGTGKELAADRLHFLSPRWEAPLLKTNCAAIAEPLLESELFGHEPGAFTGATKTHHGRFERADGGTLFLDELGTMSTRLQEKLLRLVEYGEFERLGGQETLQVDVRVVAATNADLQRMAEEHRFRADLLDRLSFDVVHIPALRHRPEDILELAEHFAIQMCPELGWTLFPGFSDRALAQLQHHHWPGNVRELKNAVERSLHRWGNAGRVVDEIIVDPFNSPYEQNDQPATTSDAAPAALAASQSDVSLEQAREAKDEQTSFEESVRRFELRLLQQTLAANGFNQRRSAAALGLSYDQMRGLVRKYGLSTTQRGNA